ncbi:unnamed protein product [Linum tenue]|jgi:hypothetical protein
METS